MKIFMTGSTGFIGSHLVKCLSETKHELICIARKTSNIKILEETGARIIYGDILDKTSVISGMQGCDWLVHLASSFEFWVPDKRIYEDVNIQGVRNVMESALETGIKKVVHVSTAAVYGDAPFPITEESDFGAKRSSRYAETKYQGDLLAWQMYQEQNLPLVVIYPSAVIGPDDPKAAGRYLKKFARGTMPAQVVVDSIFPWVHVKDVCVAILRALEKGNNIGEKYIVSACNLTWREINQMICEVSGSRLPIMTLPNSLTMVSAHLLTGIADIIKSPPILDLSVDQISLMKQGCAVDGSKAERELGLSYTPIREAVVDAVANLN